MSSYVKVILAIRKRIGTKDFRFTSSARFHLTADDSFYIILQGSVNIYRLDDEAVKSTPLPFDTVKEFARLDVEPEKREELIAEVFGNYIVTLGKDNESIISCYHCCADTSLSLSCSLCRRQRSCI